MTVTIAVVGTGGFAREHVATLAALPGVRVAWVAGSDLGRAASVASLAPGARPTTDIRSAIEDDAVDAVDVCNATPDHARWAIAAGRAGKHVHVDKPAALSLTDFDDMVAATRSTSLMVGQTVRFQPAVAELQRSLERGEIGAPRLLHLSWYTGHVWPGGWRGWQLDISKSGGHPVHNGTHAIDLAVWLMGARPIEVFARDFPTFAAEMTMPDSFQLIVRFDNGALATLELCYALRAPGDMLRRIMLAGTTGTLTHSTEDDSGLSSPGHPQPPSSITGALRAQLGHWRTSIATGTPPIVTTEQARWVLATALAAQQSLVTGVPMRIAHEEAAA